MISFFKKFYLSKTVFIVWIAGLGYLFPLSVLMSVMSGQITVLIGLIFAVTLMLIVSLIVAYRRHDLILMNGLITAIMITEILRYAYVVGAYLQMDTETIVELGFMYCLELALRTFALLVEVLIAYNHYTLNTKQANNQTKIIVNQFALVILNFVFLGIIVVNWFANTDPWVLLSISLIYLCDILLYGAVSCCEATLSVDRIDNTMMRGSPFDIKAALWYLVMFLFGLFGLIMAYLIKGLPTVLVLGDLFITILCGVELFYYLNRKKIVFKKIVLAGQMFAFPISLGAVCFMAVFFMVMFSQFHAKLQPDAVGSIDQLNMAEVASAENAYVFQTDDFYIIFPQYKDIDFEFDKRPSPSDESITYYGAAAMVDSYKLGFDHMNIIGDHVKNGEYYKGGGANFPENMGAFIFYDGKGHIVSDKHDDLNSVLKQTAAKGGDGFQQDTALYDNRTCPFDGEEFRYCRVLTEINGRFCIVDSVLPMYLNDFTKKLQELGLKDALILDSGAGWNHSWYRNNQGEVINLFGFPIPFSTNWIVFRK